MILQGKFGEGEATGKVWLVDSALPIKERALSEKDLKQAFLNLEHQLKSEQKKLKTGKDFLDFPLAILKDPELWETVQEWLKKDSSILEAVTKTFVQWEKTFQQLDDPYLRERTKDLIDLRMRLVRTLGNSQSTQFPKEPFILFAKDVYVTDLLEWRKSSMAGICLEEGNESAHGVMLAKSLHLPIVGGVKDLLRMAQSKKEAALFGDKVYLDEPPPSRASKQSSLLNEKESAQFVTRDGTPIALRANVQLPEEIERAKQAGAQGIGLFRTEFLYISKEMSLKEESSIYQNAIETFHPYPVVFRLADLGSDKPYTKVEWPQETNPALGWRGLRFLLDQSSILKRQLQALFTATRKRTLHLLLPMVRSSEEIEAFLKIMDSYKAQYDAKVRLGIMLETPSSIYVLRTLTKRVAFVSLGTNDLFQYFFAVDRVHPTLKIDPLHPLFFSYLHDVVELAKRKKKSVSLCGELAGNEKALPILLRLGLREFSLSIPKISIVANALSKIKLDA